MKNTHIKDLYKHLKLMRKDGHIIEFSTNAIYDDVRELRVLGREIKITIIYNR